MEQPTTTTRTTIFQHDDDDEIAGWVVGSGKGSSEYNSSTVSTHNTDEIDEEFTPSTRRVALPNRNWGEWHRFGLQFVAKAAGEASETPFVSRSGSIRFESIPTTIILLTLTLPPPLVKAIEQRRELEIPWASLFVYSPPGEDNIVEVGETTNRPTERTNGTVFGWTSKARSPVAMVVDKMSLCPRLLLQFPQLAKHILVLFHKYFGLPELCVCLTRIR